MRRTLQVSALALAAIAGGLCAAEQAQPEPVLTPAAKAVAQLGSLSFREREAASNELWELGAAAVEELAKASKSGDPEVARRARILLDRIRSGIGPDTPAEIVELVQRYGTGTRAQKITVLERLRGLGAFVQIIRLHHFEEDETVRSNSSDLVNAVVLPAVNSLLYADDLDGAVALLQVSPETPQKYRRLAALLRAEGGLDKKIAELQERNDPAERDFLLACYQAAGDIDRALPLARELGRGPTVASLSVLRGDPVPYLDWLLGMRDLSPKVRMHTEICYERWHGREKDARSLLRPMMREAREDGDDEGLVVHSLFLNGFLKEGIEMLSADFERRQALEIYYDGVEQPGKILQVYGFPEDRKGREQWLEEQRAAIMLQWDLYNEDANNFFGVVRLYAERGEREEARRMLDPLAKAARKEGWETWIDLLAILGSRTGDSIELGFDLMHDAAGDDPAAKFEELSALMAEWEASFDNFATHLRTIWDYLGENPEMTPGDRALAVGKVFGVVHADPAEQRQLWDQLVARAGQDRRPVSSYETLLIAALMRGDVAVLPPLLEMMVAEPGGDRWRFLLLEHYAYRHDWVEAERVWEEFLKANENGAEAFYFSVGYYAVLRRVGKDEEADKILRRFNALHMDEPGELSRIAETLESAGLWEEAATYWRRILLTSGPIQGGWLEAGEHYLRHAKNTSRWNIAAALSQVDVVSAQVNTIQMSSLAPWFALRKHFNVSFYRALKHLANGEEGEARRLLDESVTPIMGDGVLADDFFPILRREGHTELHDHYFEICYERMQDSIRAFPGAHNTHNSAAWLASRANRRLDDAEKHSAKALSMRPRQAAYLDTMAEVWFARRDREKAVEWSTKSMRDAQNGGHSREGGGAELRAQHDRFLTGEFPDP